MSKANDTALQIVNGGLSALQVLELSIRLGTLARAAIAEGRDGVTAEEMQASIAGVEGAIEALRARVEATAG